jgi:hypothetical protein
VEESNMHSSDIMNTEMIRTVVIREESVLLSAAIPCLT